MLWHNTQCPPRIKSDAVMRSLQRCTVSLSRSAAAMTAEAAGKNWTALRGEDDDLFDTTCKKRQENGVYEREFNSALTIRFER